ncbi:MAG: helix-turn-helix domain-containing protein, partial [Hyphomonadaceae bacterium]
MDGAESLDLILRGLAIGALIATAAGLWRGGKGHSARVAGVLFSLSVIAYTLQSSAFARAAIGPLEPLAHLMALGGSGLFWLFIVTLFDDRALSPATFAPFAGLTLLGLFGWLGPRALQPGVWIVHNLIEVGLAGHALFVIVRSWRGDLVEARRRLRGPFLAAVTLFVVVLAGFEIGESFGVEADWYELLGAVALAIFCAAGAVVFLQAQPSLFGVAEPQAPDELNLDAGDQHTLARLEEVMGKGEAWRREGLTIGSLAGEVGVPEHRLRRLINDQLGHRNFVAFVNAYRIGAAKERLADPATARTPISTIVFELGFASLGPFNRAFKEATGQTPSEWRKAPARRLSDSGKSALILKLRGVFRHWRDVRAGLVTMSSSFEEDFHARRSSGFHRPLGLEHHQRPYRLRHLRDRVLVRALDRPGAPHGVAKAPSRAAARQAASSGVRGLAALARDLLHNRGNALHGRAGRVFARPGAGGELGLAMGRCFIPFDGGRPRCLFLLDAPAGARPEIVSDV